MGPRKHTDRMLQEIESNGGTVQIAEAQLTRLRAPVGLNIGAEGPREIALSIVAEIQAGLNGRDGGRLRGSDGPIRGAAF